MKIIAVDAESRLIKVHFVGWDTRYDEWKADTDDDDFPIGKYEKLQLPSPETKDERSAMLSQELYREVKRNLHPGHKGNPEVRFEIKIDEDIYNIICMYGIDSKARGKKSVTGLQNNRDFDFYLGKGWDRRIIN